ncbi:MAG: FHA domain-containing protein [Candidatus Schekmanbacteria bacterium]|nr:FHA domain-containing protein [Candidatus Schekmanbacteria bacterium]
MKKLIIIDGTQERELELADGKYYLGRLSSNQIQLTEGGVSRRHAKIEVVDQKAILSDLGSLNGTYVNDVEIRIRELQDEDTIEIGSYLLKYIDEDVAARPQEPVGAPVLGADEALVAADKPRATGVLAGLRGKIPVPELGVRARLVVWVVGLVLFSSMLVGIPISGSYRDSLEAEAKTRSLLAVQYHAVTNREALAATKIGLIDCETIARYPGVERAYVLDRTGHILVPAAAVSDATFQEAARSPELLVQSVNEVTDRLSYPIRLDNERLGTAVIDFSYADVRKQGKAPFALIAVLALFAGAFAAAVSLVLARLAYRPIDHLTQELEVRIKNGSWQTLPRFKAREVNQLAETLQRFLERADKGVDEQAEPHGGEELGVESLPLETVQRLVEHLPNGVLLVTADNRVAFANALARGLIGNAGREPRGRHLLEVFREGELRSVVIECLKKVSAGAVRGARHREVTAGGSVAVEVHGIAAGGGKRGMHLILIEPLEVGVETRAIPRVEPRGD